MNQYKYLFIDVDGTLLDFQRAEEYALDRTFMELTGDSPGLENAGIFNEVNEQLWREFEEHKVDGPTLKYQRAVRFLETAGIKGDPQKWSEVYVKSLSQASFSLPGAEKALKYCAEDHNLAIITNGLKEVQVPRISNSFIPAYARNIFISEVVGYAKPRKEYFDFVLRSMGVEKRSQVLIIGDGLRSDILGGNNSGIDTVWINPSGKDPEGAEPGAVVKSFYDFALDLGMGVER